MVGTTYYVRTTSNITLFGEPYLTEDKEVTGVVGPEARDPKVDTT